MKTLLIRMVSLLLVPCMFAHLVLASFNARMLPHVLYIPYPSSFFATQAMALELTGVQTAGANPIQDLPVRLSIIDQAIREIDESPQKTALNIQEVYRRLAQETVDIAKHEQPEGGILLLGGIAGIGKTTLTASIETYLTEHGIWVRVLHLDKFLLPEIVRRPFRESILAVGQKRPDARKFIVDGESLEKQARNLISSRPVGGWLIIDGGWPMDAPVFREHFRETLSFLIVANKAEARARFLRRDAGQMSPEDFARYYDLAIAPTREAYEQDTQDTVSFVIDINGLLQDARIRRAS